MKYISYTEKKGYIIHCVILAVFLRKYIFTVTEISKIVMEPIITIV